MNHCLETDIQEIANRLGNEAQRFAGSTVLLAGGHGFIGCYFVSLFKYLNEHVLRPPCRLIAVDNHITSHRVDLDSSDRDGYRFISHEVIEPLELDEPLDYVIHAASIASPYYYRKYPLQTLEVATTGTKNLLELGLRYRLKGFLFMSSSEIYGDPDEKHVPTPESYRGNVSCLGPRACYDESKRLGETLCSIFHELHGIPTKITRPFNVYGPGMQETDYRVLANFASEIVAGKPLQVYGSGRQTRTFCYVTDAVLGFVKVLLNGSPGEAYNIGAPAPEISILDLVAALERVLGRPLPVKVMEYPDSYPTDEPQRRCPDIRKAALQLNYQPVVGLEEGLRRFTSWALKHYRGFRF